MESPSFNYQESDKISGGNVATRIEAALEALPNGVLRDVQVTYGYGLIPHPSSLVPHSLSPMSHSSSLR